MYRFPPGTDGAGQGVAIIELGGGFTQSELDTYFAGLGITGPTVHAAGVHGATNKPGADPQGADGEVLLDIEVVGALAPGATVSVYFAPNTDAGFLEAISQAAHATPTPTAMSISWGQNEDAWTGQARTALDQGLADAAALGITVTAAAGDDGSTDRATDARSHVDFPAASPHVLACGGTRPHRRSCARTKSTLSGRAGRAQPQRKPRRPSRSSYPQHEPYEPSTVVSLVRSRSVRHPQPSITANAVSPGQPRRQLPHQQQQTPSAHTEIKQAA